MDFETRNVKQLKQIKKYSNKKIKKLSVIHCTRKTKNKMYFDQLKLKMEKGEKSAQEGTRVGIFNLVDR